LTIFYPLKDRYFARKRKKLLAYFGENNKFIEAILVSIDTLIALGYPFNLNSLEEKHSDENKPSSFLSQIRRVFSFLPLKL